MQKNQEYKTLADLSKCHSYRLQAKAKYLTQVHQEQDLLDATSFATLKKIPYVIIGKGSNILFKDNYYPGLVIVNKLSSIEIKGTSVTAQSGVSTQLLARRTAKENLTGLQWFIGIPGTIGGAVFMNAGCLGFDTSQLLEYVDVIHMGEKKRLTNKQCKFFYRESIFQSGEFIILQAKFNLKKCENARDPILQYQKKRLLTQPVEKKNSGCVFKNPSSTVFAGKLIEECGLKGMEYKGLQISDKHANFINSNDDASAKDVEAFISLIKKQVKEQKGVELEHEIRII